MRLIATSLCLTAALAGPAAAAPEDKDVVARGKYLFHAGACDSCHTDVENDGAFLAGGRAMETMFGTFYVPNITPARESGIGNWSNEDFRNAMLEGMNPDGAPYYPVFPYSWYTG
ncbi:MAG TPA: cytochrome C, partial [Alphaproteobacteria bacterium]|nr:cytochrome C [Alphaproteobacteria bacterium]